jgi:hypothetical protein
MTSSIGRSLSTKPLAPAWSAAVYGRRASRAAAALQAGASGFVLKDRPIEEVMAGIRAAVYVGLLGGHREDEHPRVRRRLEDASRDFPAPLARRMEAEEDHVRCRLARSPDGRLAAGHLTYHLEPVLPEEPRQMPAKRGIVVRDQHAGPPARVRFPGLGEAPLRIA